MDAWIGVGAAVGTVAFVTVGVLALKKRSASARSIEPKVVVVHPDVGRRVNQAYGEWLFRLQEKCPWCSDGMFRSVQRTMKLNVADGSLSQNTITQCSRCRWRVDAEPDPLAPEHFVCAPDARSGPVTSWSVQTASGSPIAEVSVGGGEDVQVTPSTQASESKDPRILLATLLFRGACAVPLAGMAPDEARVVRGTAVQARIVRAQIVGMPRVAKIGDSLPPPSA